MTTPITVEQASARGLIADKGIHTFSNGSEWECWADENCLSCSHYDIEAPFSESVCAFEAAAMLGIVSPALAVLFGWKERADYPGSYEAPVTCPFFRDENDNDGDRPRTPKPSDPAQLVLLADPTEDAATITNAVAETMATTEVG